MASFLTETSVEICNHPAFVSDFSRLTVREITPQRAEQLNEDEIVRLLESSAILSLSEDESHQMLAYKIAVYLLSQYAEAYDSIPFVGQVVLTRLGDLPVIQQMVVKNEVPDFFSYFSRFNWDYKGPRGIDPSSVLSNFPEAIQRKASNQQTIAGSHKLSLTDFQSQILTVMKTGANLAFSAPTSSGKSYVLHNLVADRMFSNEEFCAVYIVPTKALVAEAQKQISESVRLVLGQSDFVVFTGASTLNSQEVSAAKKKVFVLTQERLQDMIANQIIDFPVDLLVVDEAQQVANDSRGIVIEDAVVELVRSQPKMQKVFVSPYVTNPEKFRSIFGLGTEELQTARTKKSPVGQNIIFVTFRKEGRGSTFVTDASVLVRELRRNGEAEFLTLVYDKKLTEFTPSAFRYKAWVAQKVIAGQEPTLIYCNRPSDCRKVADEIASTAQQLKELSPKMKETISFLRSNVHPRYYLADYLKNQIGYHYGTMPQFVRNQVKRLFEDEEITLLACTSTLLEGVNLPAKNLVLFDPRKGPLPMDSLSVRNLMGRAGRLSRDYYGKIYCVNVEEWESGKDAFEDKPEPIESSSETALSEEVDDLIHYLNDVNFEASKRTVAMATSLLMKQLLYPDRDFLSTFKERHQGIDPIKLEEVRTLLREDVARLELGKEVMVKNRSFDPRLQDSLYRMMMDQDIPLMPPFPTWDMYKSLVRVFEVISTRLMQKKNKLYKRYAVIASMWINQEAYKKILLKEIDYEIRGKPSDSPDVTKKINEVIEELDDTIEDKIRYDYVRGMKCYCDILEYVEAKKSQKWTYCERLPMFIEAGASDERILFLIGAGLSRTVAIELYESFGGREGLPEWKSVGETIVWLRANGSRLRRNLHPFFFSELEDLFGIETPDNAPRY
ncbi:MAG: DEAD/DEAH box helicase [Nitrososphaerota archaeon]|nr:DEAD/DEAH box helicase [Nitrososphaerota archaeon]MDG7023711.1 DEAD/DEAH box helicase [Nitrososphaerota archaeon]